MSSDVNKCTCPTLTYPNGGESISTRTLEVTWYRENLHGDEPNDDVWYEIYFTDSYDPEKQNAWVQIATSPSNANSFTWNVPFSIKSNKCRMGIRCRNFHGATSDMHLSAGNFTIAKRLISPPAIVRPVPGEIYRQSIPIVFDHSAIKGTASQRAFYQVSYSSDSLGIDWTILADKISIDKKQIVIDSSSWSPSEDYAFRVFLIDDDGDVSSPAFVRGLKIFPLAYFILDSKPPKGTLAIQGNSEFITNRNITLSLSAIDEATEVKTISIGEFGETPEEARYNDIVTWRLTSDDGLKTVQAAFIDAGGNSSENGVSLPISTYYADSNAEVDALYVDADDLPYFVIGGSVLKLVEGKSERADTPSEVTSMTLYESMFYFGVISSDNKGSLYRESVEGTISLVQAFTADDSRITAMESYKDVLYIGLQTGELYSYDGSAIALVSTRANTITGMLSDENNLYIFVDNESQIEIYNGTSFSTVSVENASI